MPYQDIPSAGTSLSMDSGYGAAEIPGCTDITWDGYGRAVRSPTHLKSPAVVKRPGMPNFGQIKAKVFYDPQDATHQAIQAAIELTAAEASLLEYQFTIDWADGYASVTVIGFISGFAPSATDAETGTVTCDLTIEVSELA